ncbi:MAG: glycosyl hydrolase family 28-related protein [Nitrosopumilaceae archaeon]
MSSVPPVPLVGAAAGVIATATTTAFYVVENYAVLDALTGVPDGTQINVTGALSTAVNLVPDGGGGLFVYRAGSTATHDKGLVRTAVGMGVGRFHRIVTNSILNVKWFEAKGDGVTDDTAKIELAKTTMGEDGHLYFPKGIYLLSSTVDFSNINKIRLTGEGWKSGSSLEGSVIIGTVSGDLIKYVNTGSGHSFYINGIYFNNLSTNSAASSLHVDAFVMGEIDNCQFSGNLGLNASDSTFNLTVRSCKFNGSLAVFPNGVGINIVGHSRIENCDITGWALGVAMTGNQSSIDGCRLEVNKRAIDVGRNKDGTDLGLNEGHINNCSFEANDYDIRVRNTSAFNISSINTQGSIGSPSSQSILGLEIEGASKISVFNYSGGGGYSDASMRLHGASGAVVTFDNVNFSNSVSTGKVWDVKAGGDLTDFTFNKTNYKPRGDDSITTFRGIEMQSVINSLAAMDHLNGMVLGKNIRGKGITLGSGITTKTITFTGNGHTPGNAAINTATAVAGGSLPNNTYFLVATAVTERGECNGTGEKTVITSGSNNSIDVTFFGMTADGFKRRIYLGTVSGVYNGYYETALNLNSTFNIANLTFTGRRTIPNAGIDGTSMIEPDANYAVIITPSWLTTIRVTSKATTGFTVDFGTATPDANQTVDYFIIR